MNARLIAIEARRTVAFWFVPLMVALTLLFDNGMGLAWRLYLWPEMSVMVRDSLILIGPAIAGVAAWMAGRDSRRRIGDLLATTPRPAFARQTAAWAGTAIWGLAAYIIAGAVLVALTLTHALWGGPTLWPILIGLLTIAAEAAIGYAVGSYIPSRFTAPLVVIAVLVAQVGFGWNMLNAPANLRPLEYLSPVASLDSSVWYGIRPDVGPIQVLFLLGLIGLGLGALALRDRANRVAWGVLGTGLALSVAAVATLVVSAPPSYLDLQASRSLIYSGGKLAAWIGHPIPYTPVCAGAPIQVCVHPAYAPYLRGDTALINRLAAPLYGLPGAPTRAEQRSTNDQGVLNRTLAFIPGDATTADYFSGPIALSLVRDNAFGASRGAPLPCPGDVTRDSCFQTQDALGIWLSRRAGLRLGVVIIDNTPVHFFFGQWWDLAFAAAQRFAAVPPERQHAWLRAHYLALRQGQVPLKDLP
jgi:hypothetical protein